MFGIDRGISPRWGYSFLRAILPRADAPWAIGSRPVGAKTGDEVATICRPDDAMIGFTMKAPAMILNIARRIAALPRGEYGTIDKSPIGARFDSPGRVSPG